MPTTAMGEQLEISARINGAFDDVDLAEARIDAIALLPHLDELMSYGADERLERLVGFLAYTRADRRKAGDAPTEPVTIDGGADASNV